MQHTHNPTTTTSSSRFATTICIKGRIVDCRLCPATAHSPPANFAMGADTIITAAQHWARPRPSLLHPRCQVLSILRPAPVGPPEAPPPCERSSSNVQSPSQREACLRLLAPTRASRDPASSHPVALSERSNSARGAVPIRVGDSGLGTHGGPTATTAIRICSSCPVQGHAAVHGKIAGDSHPWSPSARPIRACPFPMRSSAVLHISRAAVLVSDAGTLHRRPIHRRAISTLNEPGQGVGVCI